MPLTLADLFEECAVGTQLGVLLETDKDWVNESLKKHVDDIWDEGVDAECMDGLITFFTKVKLEKIHRSLILDCLVPNEVISDESVQKMIVWVFCNCIKLPDESADVLRWLKTIVRFNMVNIKIIHKWYNELLKRLLYPKLIKSLSEILCLAAAPVFMTKTNVDLLESFFVEHYENIYIKRVLWEYAQHVPHLVNSKFHFSKPNIWTKDTLAGFEIILKARADIAGVASLNQPSSHPILCKDLPPTEYQTRQKEDNLIKIGEVKSMYMLGRSLERIQLPTNELALLQSAEGIMTVIVEGPSHNFLSCLTVALSKPTPTHILIAGISGLQDLLSYGLPPVTLFLSDFLIRWDGNYKEEYVYSLLPRLYFQDFKELKENILDHLLRVFVTNSAETKVKILDSLVHLITNMVAVDMKRGNLDLCKTIPAPKWIKEPELTVLAVIEFTIELCKQGLTLEGLNCTLLVLNAILFYQKLNTLVLECDWPFFYVIHPSLSNTALLSKNQVVVNELCSLILEYKQKLIPHFEQKGQLGEFEVQVESVMAIADSIYKYLWESVGGERPEDFHTTQNEFTPAESIGVEHLGLFPFLFSISKELNKDIKKMDKNDVMALLEAFMSGVSEFLKYEVMEQLRH